MLCQVGFCYLYRSGLSFSVFVTPAQAAPQLFNRKIMPSCKRESNRIGIFLKKPLNYHQSLSKKGYKNSDPQREPGTLRRCKNGPTV